MADKPTCATCRFAGWTGSPWRECRRHAPITGPGMQRLGGVNDPIWPMVEERQWCGDHEPAGVTWVGGVDPATDPPTVAIHRYGVTEGPAPFAAAVRAKLRDLARYEAADGVAGTPAPDPRMAFCPACFVEVTPEQADQQTLDARRYRTLRDRESSRPLNVSDGNNPLYGEALDRAVDAALGVALPASRSTACEHQCAEEQVGGTRCKIVCGVVELPPMDASGVAMGVGGNDGR